MEWTEETISRLRSLWQEGLSTAEIGRRMSITKNAVVGKAHRLTLPPRPSPIRKGLLEADMQRAARREAARPERAVAAAESGQVTRLVPRPAAPPYRENTGESAGAVPSGRADETMAASVTPLHAVRPSVVSGLAVADTALTSDLSHDPETSDPGLGGQRVRRGVTGSTASHASSQPAQRRRGQSCCWPLGEPGTKQFRFCGGEPIPGKPYCSEHAQLAYVKLRDRRDTVA